jgi:hypothetical protein
MSVTDRLGRLEQNAALFTGIDFVHVVDRCEQTTLRIYLVTDARGLTVDFAGATALTPESIVIESVTDANLPRVKVVAIAAPGGNQVQVDELVPRTFLEVQVEEPGEFGLYRLHIDDPSANPSGLAAPFSRIDRYFNDVVFSFKAGCEDNQDCAPAGLACPPEPLVDFPVDYLARDFVSLRNALLDFAAQRYPQWTLPIEADAGMMLAEVMAALGDELSYMQDRHAREAYLETATQRRSLRRKARLLDFEIHDGRSPSTLLELVLSDAPTGPIPAGTKIWAPSETLEPIPFEIGLGLFDRVTPNGPRQSYVVRLEWNADQLSPYWFDERKVCLPVGATEMFVVGKLDPEELPRRAMLLRTEPTDRALPARRHFVTIAQAEEVVDPLMLPAPLPGEKLVRIRWAPDQAPPFELDQRSLQVSLNIVPATAGETLEQNFVRGSTFDSTYLSAVEREGPRKADGSSRAPIVLLGLPATETLGLGFLGDDLRNTRPEIEVVQLDENGQAAGDAWTWVRSLLSESAADEVFTLEDGVWRRIRVFRRAGEEFVHRDYATGAGFSVRFGDGEFGIVPDEEQRFLVRYRTGPGIHANVPEGAVHLLALEGASGPFMPSFVASASNPLPVTNGVAPESAREIKQLAPQAYQADVLFAVQAADYAEQAQKLQFVQRAQGTPRWTGSWQAMSVAVDPFGSTLLTSAERNELAAWMDCVRQVGREVVVRDPDTIPIDLELRVCVEPFAYASQVAAQVQEVLLGRGLNNRPKGFFHPDNLTFGTPLRRSALEAAVQAVPGVRGVRGVRVRLRGARRKLSVLGLNLEIAPNQILRLDNDPVHPEAGTLTILTEGGA